MASCYIISVGYDPMIKIEILFAVVEHDCLIGLQEEVSHVTAKQIIENVRQCTMPFQAIHN